MTKVRMESNSILASPDLRQLKLSGAFIILSLILFLLTTSLGLLAIAHYSSHFTVMQQWGLEFRILSPLHTFCAITFIFTGGLAVVFSFLFSVLKRQRVDEKLKISILNRCWVQLVLWISAGILTGFCLSQGNFTGREYIAFTPEVSFLILAGWLLYAYSFLQIMGFRIKKQPVFVWMWFTGLFLFVFTFAEAHLYLLDYFFNRPIRDIAIQWKSYGALIGSMNLVVYGSLIYISGKISNDSSYAHSKLAFSLFFLGTLNSFTNFAHHTYHLPQSNLVQSISFVVSMLEIIILLKVLLDLLAIPGLMKHSKKHQVTTLLLCSVTFWTFLQLILSLLISIPPLNALIHGTFVILAHSMGTMIGIDTLAILAGISYLSSKHINSEASKITLVSIWLLNLGLLVLWVTFLWQGITSSYDLFTQGMLPSSLNYKPATFIWASLGGLLFFTGSIGITLPWLVQWLKKMVHTNPDNPQGQCI